MAPKRILLHICCGPCAIYPVQALREQGFEVIGLYFNPNIHPLQEYLKRREGLVETAERLKLKVIYKDADYDPKTYLRAVAFREANRCFHCYTMRLEKTWSVA
ncbi:MAG: epoxyqueuosine reductase QueH, partial [Desulfoplanes sp.]